MDDEIKGEGNSVNYAFRMHDPRLGRFFAIDPLTKDYPWNSPYAFSENKVIHCGELEGLESAVLIVPRDENGRGLSNFNADEVHRSITSNLQRGAVIGSLILVDALVTKGWLSRAYFLHELGSEMNATDAYHSATTPGAKAEAKRRMEAHGPGVAAGAVGELAVLAVPKMLKVFTNTGKWVKNNSVRFSQSSVNGLDEIVTSMNKDGWVGDPIDIVKMEDGIHTTVDNTRLLAARRAGIDVKANVHSYDEAIPAEMAGRFTRNSDGAVPNTWGDAVKYRISNQKASFRKNESGSFVEPSAKSGTGE